jgi:hypothetical protein
MTTQNEETNTIEESKTNSNMINDLLSSIMTQSSQLRSSPRPLPKKDKKIENIDDEEEDEDEDEDDEDDLNEDEDEDEDEDLRWIALHKLLDSHLRITKSFLHLVRES